MTPYKVRYEVKADLSVLPEWGTKVFVLKENQGKLEPRSDEGRWVGYSSDTKGHHIYWHCVTDEHNLMFDTCTVLVPSDVQTEGEPTSTQDQHTP
ncbi:hypothetical protein K439DRAFT_1357255 [Ramaria rubella]|nr:hypothetical protein K439DRAFT_1357255 [Ramaria rubella]